jgi:hypothetical protein
MSLETAYARVGDGLAVMEPCAHCGEIIAPGHGGCLGCEGEPWVGGVEDYFESWGRLFVAGRIDSLGNPVDDLPSPSVWWR